LISRPPSWDAFKVYEAGAELTERGEYALAVPQYLLAFEMDSTFLRPLFAAINACLDMHNQEKADSLLGILEARRDQLSPVDLLRLEGRAADIAGNWEGVYRSSAAVSRDSPAADGYGLGNSALHVRRPEEARQVLLQVDHDILYPLGFSPYWDRLATANHLTGRHEEALEAARQGLSRIPEAVGLRRHEIRALAALGRMAEIPSLLDSVEAMEPYHGSAPGIIIRQLAADFLRMGYRDDAIQLAERALDWYSERDPGGFRRERAQALLQLGRSQEALELLQDLVERPAEDLPVSEGAVGESPEIVTVHGLYGMALAQTGDTAAAEAEARWLEDPGPSYLRGSNTYWRAAILAHLGHQDVAVRTLGAAIDEGWYFVDLSADPHFMPIWDYESYERLIAPRG
jgi:tetratricopeptide (TPR) repeat protein